MDQTELSFTSQALLWREAVNIALIVFMAVLCFLLVRFIIKEIIRSGWFNLDWPAKFAIGLCILFTGEFIRAATILEVIHFKGLAATYATDVVPVIASLALVALGGLYAIRVMTPEKWGHWVWVGSLVASCLLILASRFF